MPRMEASSVCITFWSPFIGGADGPEARAKTSVTRLRAGTISMESDPSVDGVPVVLIAATWELPGEAGGIAKVETVFIACEAINPDRT